MSLSPEEIDFADETSGCIDLDVASQQGDVLNADGLTLFKIVGNDF